MVDVPRTRDIWTSDRLHIAETVYDPGAPLLVTFTAVRPSREAYAGPLCRARRINHIAVTCAAPEWWQYPEIDRAGAALRSAAKAFPRVVHYGSSMGGFGALFLSALVEPDAVLAIGPQFSIAPGEPPEEARWADFRAAILAGGGFLAGGMAPRLMRGGEVVVVYDPHDADARQVALFAARRPLQLVEVPHAAHDPSRVLADLGLASRLVVEVLAGTFDPAAFRRELAAGLRRHPLHLLAEAEARLVAGRDGAATRVRLALRALPEGDPLTGRLLQAAVKAGDRRLAARCLLAHLDGAVGDGGPVLLALLRQHAGLLAEAGLVAAAEARLAAWDAVGPPDPRALAALCATLRRGGPADPPTTSAAAALKMLRRCGTPDTTLLARLAAALIRHAAGRPAEAAEMLADATRELGGWHPFNAEAARIWAAFGDHRRAAMFAKRVVAREPGNAAMALLLGAALEALDQPEEAIAAYRTAIAPAAGHPTGAALLVALARCLHAAGRPQEALAALDRLLARQPDHRAGLRLRIAYLEDLGRPDEAVAAGQAALAVADDPWITRRLATLAKRTGGG